ncbi:MAG: DUF2191 domain-containing protein [Desulfobacteraceae bacterium IS3]|nr:MAG: DUF2191 domain-containing protein [Desulfobacteraceae bacterium IS3]
MTTHLAIDDNLIERVLSVAVQKTKEAAVTEALEEYICRRQQVKIIDLFGTIDFDPEYDYKIQRSKK